MFGRECAAVGRALCGAGRIGHGPGGDFRRGGRSSCGRGGSAEGLHIYDIADRFQIYHGLGLLFIGVLIRQYGKRRLLYAAGGLMVLGILLFCGGLYLLALTSNVFWAFFAPVGGTALILSWLLLALSMWRVSAT